MTTYYKITAADGAPIHGGTGKWSLPKGDKPGAWRSVKGDLVPCENGLHVVEAKDLPRWVATDAVAWEVETAGTTLSWWGMDVVRRARLTRKVGTLTREVLVAWACDCAERALPIYEAKYPDDDRPHKALATTRAWLRGEATIDQVRAAAAAAVVAAVYAAAYAAVYADLAAAYAAYAAAYAADAAAYAADAADAADAAERQWQGERLLMILEGDEG